MLVTFRIEDTRTQLHSTPAEISALELAALTTTVTTPEIYALGTSVTAVSFTVIFGTLAAFVLLQRRRRMRALAG